VSLPAPGELVALRRILALAELKRWGEAATAARSLLAADPANWQALCLLAQALIAENDFSGGLEAAQAAVALAPESDWPHRLISIACRLLGRPAPALNAAREAVALSPHLDEAHRVLCQAQLVSGDLEAAAASALVALELDPHEAANHRMIGMVAFHCGELDAAEAAYRRALEIHPDDAVSHNELARVALKRSSQSPAGLARSARGFASALAADPRQSISRSNLDVVLALSIARGAYVLFIAAWVTAILQSSYPAAARVVGVLALLVPIGFVVRFLTGLTPQLRGVLMSVVAKDAVLSAAVLAEVLAAVALAAGALSTEPGLSIGAVVGAIIARGLIYTQLRSAIVIGGARHARTSVLWLVVLTLVLCVALGFGVAVAGGGSGTDLAGVGVGSHAALAMRGVLAVIWRRRRALRTPVTPRA
jgi:tetratricopeptide (TPR) repeat protein